MTNLQFSTMSTIIKLSRYQEMHNTVLYSATIWPIQRQRKKLWSLCDFMKRKSILTFAWNLNPLFFKFLIRKLRATFWGRCAVNIPYYVVAFLILVSFLFCVDPFCVPNLALPCFPLLFLIYVILMHFKAP